MLVQVSYNLSLKSWALNHNGGFYRYADELTLLMPRPIYHRGALGRWTEVNRTKCALIEGTLYDLKFKDQGRPFTFDPRVSDRFYYLDDESEVTCGEMATFKSGRHPKAHIIGDENGNETG